jgi:hypothetical protein
LGIVVSYLTARAFLTPPSFGQYGWYRGAALEEIAARTPVYAGKKSCDECHSDILEKLAKDKHRTLSCEACHGVSQAHVDNPNIKPGEDRESPPEVTAVTTASTNREPKSVKLAGAHCIRCHEANPSRPAWFKQITVKNHYTGQKCGECHVPHQPNEVP